MLLFPAVCFASGVTGAAAAVRFMEKIRARKAQEQIVFGISQVFSLLRMESGQIVLISRS